MQPKETEFNLLLTAVMHIRHILIGKKQWLYYLKKVATQFLFDNCRGGSQVGADDARQERVW